MDQPIFMTRRSSYSLNDTWHDAIFDLDVRLKTVTLKMWGKPSAQFITGYKSHARHSQVINLIHQRVRAAYGKAKDPEVKSRLKRALDYIESRKESSKKKTERLRKMKEASDPQAGTALPYGSGFAPVKEKNDPFGLNELAKDFVEEVFTETWKFQDLDKNVSLPFIITVRQPEVKYGKMQNAAANIPERLRFFYYTVPTWDGQRKGADVYKIPQPVPVDITYTIKIFCNRMREVNEFNKLMMQKFTSKQAYVQINGHYMSVILEDPTDESVKEIEKRKYYIQSYKITLRGMLIDEKEFQVSPAITRAVTMLEVDTKTKSRKVKIEPPRPKSFDLDLLFVSGNTQLNEVFRYTVDLNVTTLENVSSYSVFINNNYLGDDLPVIQITDGDTLKVIVTKTDNTKQSVIKTNSVLV